MDSNRAGLDGGIKVGWPAAYDNAATWSFVQLLNRGCVNRKISALREDAKSDVFNYIQISRSKTS
jgi:hypothetical protein